MTSGGVREGAAAKKDKIASEEKGALQLVCVDDRHLRVLMLHTSVAPIPSGEVPDSFLLPVEPMRQPTRT